MLPPSINDFISDNHLSKLITEVVDNLDTKAIECKYSELGQKSYHYKVLLKLNKPLACNRGFIYKSIFLKNIPQSHLHLPS